MNIKEELFKRQDKKYQEFNNSLIPGIDKDKTIGIRIPVLRDFAKSIDEKTKYEFLKEYPHTYLEENNLHRYLIEGLRDYDEVIYYLERFVPFIDNWTTSDGFSNKQIEKHKDKFIIKVKEWLNRSEVYSKRFAISMIMRYYLDKDFLPEYLDLVGSVVTQEYYLEMMIAWFFATSLAKKYEETIFYLENHPLNEETTKMLLGKVRDTYRISDDRKDAIRELLWKKTK